MMGIVVRIAGLLIGPAAIFGLVVTARSASQQVVTLVAASLLAVVLAIGTTLLLRQRTDANGRRELGTSLVTSVIIAVSVVVLDVQTQRTSEREQAAAEELARQTELRLTLGTAVDLRGIDLRGERLAGYLLRNKNLADASLREADLTGADLTGSILVGADLSDAHMAGTRLELVVWSQNTVWPAEMKPDIDSRSTFLDPMSDEPWIDSRFGAAIEDLRRRHAGGDTLWIIDLGRLLSPGGWNPARPLYEYSERAGHVLASIPTPVFNSLRNVPSIGDEIYFTHVKLEGANGGFSTFLPIAPGDRILGRLYIHNNATEDTAASVARGVRTRLRLPPRESSRSLRITGYLAARNAAPMQVNAAADLRADVPVRLRPVPGSVSALSNAGEYRLPDEFFKASGPGVLVGTSAPDGNIPGGFANVVLVTFKLDVQDAR